MKLQLTIFDRYIGREIILSWLTVLFVLLVIVMSTELVHLLKYMAEGQFPIDSLMTLMANSLMEYAITLIPLSLFLGVLLAFGRLYKDSEMTAIMSAGIGPMQWNRPLLLVVLPVSLLCLALMFYAAPWISQQRTDFKAELNNRSEGSQFSAGQFNQSRDGKAVFFMESNDEENGLMESVFYSANIEGENTVDIAQSASSRRDVNNRLFTVMYKGHQYIGNSGEADYRVIEYDEYGVLMPEDNNRQSYLPNKSKKSMVLWNEAEPASLAEFQWRLTVPIAALISALIALPLSHTSPRSGRFAKIAVAILVYLVYSNLLGVGKTWLAQGVVPFWIGTWWVHILAILLLLILWVNGGFFSQSRSKA